jgi:hypothetical protein
MPPQRAAEWVAGPVGLGVGNIGDVHQRLAAEQTSVRVVPSDPMRRSREELRHRGGQAAIY